jgi:hypothetical protein
MVFQAVEQVGGLALRLLALAARMTTPALGQNGMIASQGLLKLVFREHAVLMHPLLGVQQKPTEFIGPSFLMLLEEEFEFPQVMLIAQGMQTILVSEVGLEVVVEDPAATPRQNIKLVHGFGAAFAMHAVESEVGGADDVQPMELAGHAHSAFVAVNQWGLGQLHFTVCQREPVLEALIGRHHRGFTQGLAEKVVAHFGQAIVGDELAVVEIDHPAAKARTVLGRGLDGLGKGGRDQAAGDRTTLDLGLMLRHFQRFLRQLEDLALGVIHQRLIAQRAALAPTARTTAQAVRHDVIGGLDRLEGPARMTRLTARPASAFLSERLGGGFGQSIGARGLAAVAAGQGQTVLEFFDLAAQIADLVFQAQQQLDQRPQAGAGQRPELSAPAHARKAERKSDVSG